MRHFLFIYFILSTFAIITSAASAETFLAKDTLDANGNLRPRTLEEVRMHRDKAIGKINANQSGMQKDNAADPNFINVSQTKEDKFYETDLDLTNTTGLVYVAIQVDDKAYLTVTEMTDSGTLTGPSIPYKVDGSALWKVTQSYKEFPEPILAGSKYKLKLDYSNTANLTKQYNGVIDYDGVNVFLIHQPMALVPDQGMAGVVGDTVKSLNTQSKITHFISPKKTPQIKEDHVILKVIGIDPKYITPGHNEQIFEWDTSVGEAVPGEPMKWSVNRSSPGRFSIKVKKKGSGVIVLETIVWIVWCDVTTTAGTAVFQIFANGNPAGSQYKNLDSLGKKWRFVFKINPASILDQNTLERPNLSGASNKPAPGAGNAHIKDPNVASDDATHQWDVSRQIQITLRNPDGISKQTLVNGNVATSWLAKQPTAVDTPISFPSSDAEGNDDPPLFGDEDINPYTAKQGSDLDHAFGELSSIDAPNLRVLENYHPPGNRYSVEFNFHEFSRLEIWDGTRNSGLFWFRISDLEKWHHYLDSTYDETAQQWIDANSSSGIGHPKP